MDPRTDEETLEALEAEIAREEEALAALRKRTRTLEVEVAAWRAPPQPAALVTSPPRKRRDDAEAALGLWIAACLVTLVWAILGFGRGGLP